MLVSSALSKNLRQQLPESNRFLQISGPGRRLQLYICIELCSNAKVILKLADNVNVIIFIHGFVQH